MAKGKKVTVYMDDAEGDVLIASGGDLAPGWHRYDGELPEPDEMGQAIDAEGRVVVQVLQVDETQLERDGSLDWHPPAAEVFDEGHASYDAALARRFGGKRGGIYRFVVG